MSSEPPTHGDEALQDSAGRERGEEPANLEAVASGALTPGSVLASILDRLPPDERHYLRLGPDASAVSAVTPLTVGFEEVGRIAVGKRDAEGREKHHG